MTHLSFPMQVIASRVRRAGFAIMMPLVAACLSLETPGPSAPLPPGGRHILFIGNSLTYTNDLPGTVAALAESVGDTVRAAAVALPNYAVIDHALGMSSAVDVIKGQSWDYVLLQQGPTTTTINRDTLIIATKALDPYIKASGGRTALFMPWPQEAQPQLFAAVRSSYQAAAQAVSRGMFVPAGDAWRAALEERPDLQLYGFDGYHPGPLGTYLAALVVYEKVTGHDARLLPGTAIAGGVTLNVPEATVRWLQRVAHETVAKYPD